MKKIILVLLIFITLSSPVFAADIEMSPSPSPTPTTVSYDLPYPGLIPGNPLYPFKVARDRLVEFLITDSLKKSEFYLLQADKHLNAGIFLANEGKYKDAEEIISKGENYLEMSLAKEKKAKEQSEVVNDVLGKLHQSSLKHQEVIKNLISSSPNDTKNGLENDLKRAQNFEKMVMQEMPAK